MNIAAEVAKKLLQIKAIKLNTQNPYTWASGMRSPIYCDNRVALSYPEVRRYIIDSFCMLSEEFDSFDHVSGVATAGIAHGALIAERLNLPFSYVRSSAKSHGRQNLIEGELKKGSRVLVVEDLISTGGSSIKAVEAIREAECTVVGVIAIFNYGFEKATNNFNQAKCFFRTLSEYNSMLSEAKRINYIDDNDLEILKSWNTEPDKWYSNNFPI